MQSRRRGPIARLLGDLVLLPLHQCRDQRLLIDNRAARDIDDMRTDGQLRQRAPVEQAVTTA